MAGNDANTLLLCQFQDDIVNDAVGGTISHSLTQVTPVNLKERYAGTSTNAVKSGTQYKYSYLGNNYSWYFDGNDDYVTIPANDPKLWMSPDTKWRYSFWIYPTAVPSSGDQYKTLFMLYADTDNRIYLRQKYNVSGNFLQFYGISVGSAKFSISTAYGESLTVNSWNFVELNFDGTNINIFINGTKCTLTVGTAYSSFWFRGSLYLMAQSTSYESSGYLSEFEFSKGDNLSVSTANYTPPTGDMVTTGWIDQSYFGANQLYLPFDVDDDDHKYGTEVEFVGSWSENKPRVEVYSSDKECPIVASTKQYLNGSCKFSTDYVGYANNSRFKPNEYAWTMRFRLRFDTLQTSTGSRMLIGQYQDATNYWYISIYYDGSNYTIRFRHIFGGTEYAYLRSNAIAFLVDTDYEIELNWDTSAMRCFVNGTQYTMNVTTAYNITTSQYITAYILFGEWNSAYNFVGNMYEYAMDKGQAIHTSGYTPSTDDFYSAGEINYTYCTVYIRFDFETGYDDYYPVAFAPKFGSSAMLLKEYDNNGFDLANHADFNDICEFGGKGTIDFWFCPVIKNNAESMYIYTQYDTDEDYFRFVKSRGTWNYRWELHTRNGSYDDFIYYAPTFTEGEWTHVACTWDFTNPTYTGQIYLDGVLVAEDASWLDDGISTNLTAVIDILKFVSTSAFATAVFLIQEFRISNVRRYTEPFTPPTEPYTSTSSYYLEVSDAVDIAESGNIVKEIRKEFSDILSLIEWSSLISQFNYELIDILDISDTIVKILLTTKTDIVDIEDLSHNSPKAFYRRFFDEAVGIYEFITKGAVKQISDDLAIVDTVSKELDKPFSDIVSITDIIIKAHTKIVTDILEIVDEFGKALIHAPSTPKRRKIPKTYEPEDEEWHDIIEIERWKKEK